VRTSDPSKSFKQPTTNELAKQVEWTSEALRAVQQSIMSRLTSSPKKKDKPHVQKSSSLKTLDEDMIKFK